VQIGNSVKAGNLETDPPQIPPSYQSTLNTMVKTALITGITGQDGSYLTELLLE